MSKTLEPLSPAELRRNYLTRNIPYTTSQDAPNCKEPVVGQDRAKEALEFGLAVDDMDYHVFVDGPQRTGKTHLVRTCVEGIAAELPPPPDWVYVHNFSQPEEPRALELPSGQARVLARDMARLVTGLKTKIPGLFESEDYSRAKDAMGNSFKARRTEIFGALDKEAREEGYVLRFESTGIMVAPADEDGQPLPEATIREMNEEERDKLRARSDVIQGKVTDSLRLVTALEKEQNAALAELDAKLVLTAVRTLFEDLAGKYKDMANVMGYLEEVRQDVVEHFERFKKQEASQLPFQLAEEKPKFREYEVNVFVDNAETKGAPVVVESNPTFPNVLGRIERQAHMGALFTDFTLLRPGSLHKANGGFLVIPVMELLMAQLPWEALKRSLRQRKVHMEDAAEQMGYTVTRTLRPQPIPLKLKVILVGDTKLYRLLYFHDPQFPKLFKVRAQMSGRMDWRPDEVESLLNHICQMAREKNLLPLQKKAMGRLVELAAEMAGDRERLTLQLSDVEDVVKEANYYAGKDDKEQIEAAYVEQAIAARRRRASMMEERLRESITRGFINLETDGVKAGQINGLAVLDSGDHAFGIPARISCSVGLGKGGVINIDRQSKLSGPFHTKGVLILSGFMRERFARRGSMTLTASLVFEQSYSTIDGDSASLAELLVLLSQVSNVPLRQDLAVTGSISQSGQVQAIGGVNHKIEGFFRLCQERGLTGSQGVVIPASNVKNLMLHPDIVAAAKKGKFSVYAVETVEQALEVFTGKKAGRLKKDGTYTARSVFHLVEEELARLRQVSSRDAKPKRKAAKKRAKPKKK